MWPIIQLLLFFISDKLRLEIFSNVQIADLIVKERVSVRASQSVERVSSNHSPESIERGYLKHSVLLHSLAV